MEKRNVLLYFSDQHDPLVSQVYGGMAKTPTLNDMAKCGTVFDAAYTSCPLCVLARMSLMSGRLASKTGILNKAVQHENWKIYDFMQLAQKPSQHLID